MSNAYFKFFKRDNKTFKGICYNNDYCIDGMNYEFSDLMINGVVIHKQLFHSEKLPLPEEEKLAKFEDGFKVLIIQVGTSSRNPDGTYDEHYEKTLYAFHDDWLMTDGKDLFVVDEHHIKEWVEITEQEFVKINKKEG
jgi:hypothetical protein